METNNTIEQIKNFPKDINVSEGEEVNEIISAMPPAWVRWGTLYLLLIIISVIFISSLIQYPDTVSARGSLVSMNAPKEVIVKANGKLVQLLVKENQPVSKNETIGLIESTAVFDEVAALSAMTDSLLQLLNSGNSNQIVHFSQTAFANLGELQPGFQTFSTSLSRFVNYLGSGFYLRKKSMLQADIGFMHRLHNELLNQKKLLTKDLTLTDSTFNAHEILKDEKIISAMDYRSEKSKLIAKQMTLPQINSSIITNESQQQEKQKEIAELENEIGQQKGIFVQALNTLRSQIEEWKKAYILSAPVEGVVSFNTFLQENQELKIGQSICFITPANSTQFVESAISQYNFGKVKIGQEVLLRFSAYPYKEFGSVVGRIEFIASVPTDSGYAAKISLTKGLITTSGKVLRYRTGLSVQIEIITEKKSILERLFDNLRNNLN